MHKDFNRKRDRMFLKDVLGLASARCKSQKTLSGVSSNAKLKVGCKAFNLAQ
jgi:hypothetical protein